MAPAPKPRHPQRKAAWCPTSVREVLRRRLYLGEVVYDRRGPEPIRVAKPELRIIANELWDAVQARLEQTRLSYLKGNDGKLRSRSPTGIAGQYLLSRLAACGKCGGPSMSGRQPWVPDTRVSCASSFTPVWPTTPGDSAVAPMARSIPVTAADTAVVEAVEKDLLRLEIIRRGWPGLLRPLEVRTTKQTRLAKCCRRGSIP